ncbi:MAG: hypothetical protein OHK93_005088 [Ramalina farinacea]|uniref:Small ribosomal subunit protein mS29 n=1 Tax=Ramalina farinacea TaxID=258253 RepID=A0AA43QVH2_9LECA|nr:hypothetical protein [Ramalina farinacea]
MCLRCLHRLSSNSLRPRSIPSPSSNAAATAPFSSTPSLPRANATITKKKPGAAPTPRPGPRTFSKKKKDITPANVRKPAIGERKALRKRVVLSNTNALEVQGLQDINEKNMMDEEMQGKVLGIPGEVVDRLRAVEAFKPAQGWGLYRRPAMLMRSETLEYAKMMDSMGTGSMRRVIVGERGSGKTTMLLQAMTLAFLKGWVVINIPEAQDLTIAQTAYSPVGTTLPTTYIQKTYTASLLRAIQRANPILETLHITQSLPQAQSSSTITTSPSSSSQQPTLPPSPPAQPPYPSSAPSAPPTPK